ncbi:MAG: N-acetylmuramoyl-L-alanine amidase [Anaerolineae bacterium]|nr:N-acetylmuramoyl-L-alanine amidase [Anaerolineae bacterium]
MQRRDFLRLGVTLGLAGAGIGELSRLAHAGRRQTSEHLLATLAAEALPDPAPAQPVIPREAWGALPPNHDAPNEHGFASADNPEGWYVYPGDLRSAYHTGVLHHVGAYYVNDRNTLLEVQRFQRAVRGWANVAYHFLVGRQGGIYAGRELNVRGTHVAGHNAGSAGVCLLGDLHWQFPTEAQLRATRGLIRWLAGEFTLITLAGHGDLNPETVCPGANLRPFLPLLAAQSGLILTA